MLDLAAEPPTARRVDVPALNTAVGQLIPSISPHAVFEHLAELMVPAVCDAVGVDIIMNGGLAAWLDDPPLEGELPRPYFDHESGTVEAPTGQASGGQAPIGFTLTAHVFSLPAEDDDWTDDREYVAALRCIWRGAYRPTSDDVAVIKLAGRSAAGAVHQSQQAELVRAQRIRIDALISRLRGLDLT